MASSAESWRRRIRRRQASLPDNRDPRERLLARVIGSPSAAFSNWLKVPPSAAAVLVGLIERDHGPAVLLTERAAHLPHHPGQISFPGGRLNETETVEQAALREAEEEVGLQTRHAELLGLLPDQLTGSGFSVSPVLALLSGDFEPVPDPAEVASVFEMPLAHVLADGVRQRVTHLRQGTRFSSEEFTYRGYRIWGATAAILNDLLEVIDEKT